MKNEAEQKKDKLKEIAKQEVQRLMKKYHLSETEVLEMIGDYQRTNKKSPKK